MTPSVFGTVLFLVCTLFLSSIWGVIRNYLVARKIGLPIIILPISHDNPIWMLIARRVMPFLKYFPFGSGRFTRFGYVGFQFDDKYRMHQELGDAITFVTPGKNWIYLCNADAIHELIRRERQGEFARPVELLAMLDVFGPNLSTVSINGSYLCNFSSSSSPKFILTRSFRRRTAPTGNVNANVQQPASTSIATRSCGANLFAKGINFSNIGRWET